MSELMDLWYQIRTVRFLRNLPRTLTTMCFFWVLALLAIGTAVSSIIGAWHIHVRTTTSCHININNVNTYPKNFRPLEYHVQINPNFQTKEYTGSVKIKLNILESTCFVLNINKLKITKLKFSDSRLRKTKLKKEGVHLVEFKYLEIDTKKVYELNLDFEGNLENSFIFKDGLYFSHPNSSFLFPCFNEAQWKSIYKLSVNRSSLGDIYDVLSNTPKNSTMNSTILTFEKTDLISSNQIGFIFFNKNIINSTSIIYKNNVQFNFYGPGIDENFIQNSLNCTVFIENYLNVDLFIKKIDFFNLGYTFEKLGLLSTSDSILCKSISKTWNGGLISFSQNDQWIQNTFINLIEISKNNNENIKYQFLNDLTNSLMFDSYSQTTPLKSNDLKLHNFNKQKGMSIFYQMKSNIDLHKLLKDIFQNYQYETLNSNQLLSLIPNSSFVDFIEYPGIPLIKIDKFQDTYFVSQFKYSFDPLSFERNKIWSLSLFGYDNQRNSLNISFSTLNYEFNSTSSYISILPGLYRIDYSIDILNKMIEHIHHLSEEEHYFLLENSFEMSFDNQLDFKFTFEIIQKLSKYNSTLVWNLIENKLNRLDNLLIFSPDLLGLKFQKYVNELIEPHLSNFNDNIEFKKIIFSIGIKYQNEKVGNYLNLLYEQNVLPYYYKKLIFRNLITHGSQINFFDLFKKYESSTNELEKEDLLDSLTFTKYPNLISQLVSISFRFRNFNILRKLSKNLNANFILWNFYLENSGELKEIFDQQDLNEILLNLSETFHSVIKYEEFQQMQKDIEHPYTQMIFDNIRRNRRFISTILPRLNEIIL
eukprot:gene2206-2380_t